jgi:hypothetical protein
LSAEAEATLDQLDQQAAAEQSLKATGLTPDRYRDAEDVLNRVQNQRAGAGLSPLTGLMLEATGVGGQAMEQLANMPFVGPYAREFIKSQIAGAEQIPAGVASLSRSGIDALRTSLRTAPENNFVGTELDQVKARRDELLAQKQQVEDQFSKTIDSGSASEADNSSYNYTLVDLQKKIDEANGILASGKVKTAPVEENNALSFLSGKLRDVQEAERAQKAHLQTLFPTTEDLDQSPVGQLASGAGQMSTQLPFMVAGPEVAAPAFMAQFAGQTYDEAKDKGADDKTAQTAALLDSFGAGLQMAALHVPAASLAKILEGSTPIKALQDIGRAMAFGSASQGSLQFYQNMVARLTGYDPKRPLDEGVLQQAAIGAALDTFTTAAGRVPGLIKYSRGAQVEVRERPGTVQQPGSETVPGAVQTGAAPPQPTGAPAAEPLAQAQTAVQATQGTPQQTLAAQGTPEEQLARSEAELTAALGSLTGQPATETAQQPPPLPTAPETTPPTTPRPKVTVVETGGLPRIEKITAAPAAPAPETPAQKAVQLDSGKVVTPEALGVEQQRDLGIVEEGTTNLAGGGVLGRKENPADRRYTYYDGKGNAYSGLTYAEANDLHEKLNPRVAEPVQKTTPVKTQQQIMMEAAQGLTEPAEPYAIQRLREVNPEAADRYGQMSPNEQASYLEQLQSSNPQWNPDSPYFQGRANIRGEAVPPPLPEAAQAPVTPDQVKATVNQAASDMGLEQRVHYVPSADQLPGRVKKSLSPEQMSGTAQTVYDKSLGELWVIGDRFDSMDHLSRSLIEDTMPRLWSDVTDLQIQEGKGDPRLGYYDIQGDRPVLNMEAIMRSANPFKAASETALEEINVHQGFSKLFGSREAEAYLTSMRAVRQRFDSLGLSEDLARQKGFNSLKEMAKAYGWDDYATNPQHNHALTEELIGSYAQRFGTREELEQSSPAWYRQALNSLAGGIRRRFGMGLSDLDVQNLIGDSFAALRRPKFGQPARYNPEIAREAQRDMVVNDAANQLAARRGDQPPEGEGAGGRPEQPSPEQMDFLEQFDAQRREELAQGRKEAAGAAAQQQAEISGRPPASAEAFAEAAAARTAAGVQEQPARIGDKFVAAERTATQAGLQEGQGVRATPTKLSMQQDRPFSERMALAQAATSVYDTRSRQAVLADARRIFREDLGGDIHAAMRDLLNTPISDAHTVMRLVVNEATNAQIADLQARGLGEAARGLELTRDRFNQTMMETSTNIAQALSAHQLFDQDGAAAVGRLRQSVEPGQKKVIGRDRNARTAYSQVQAIGRRTAELALQRLSKVIETAQGNIDRLTSNPQSLATRYLNALSDTINERMAKLGFTAAERPMLQELFNRFQGRISDALKDPAAEIPTPEAAKRMSTTASIRETLSNFPMFQRAWDETVAKLKTDNPNALFFSKLDNALAEPFGERGVRQVIRESGNDLRDLIFRHATTQDRIQANLASSLTANLGLAPSRAAEIENLFDRYYRNLLDTTAQKELESALAPVGKASSRAKGELQRLTELMSIGGLDKREFYNVMAKRYGLGEWNPETNAILKRMGEQLQLIRDEGGPEVYKNQLAAQIADEIAKNQPWKDIQMRRFEALWMASLLTGPITHSSYYGQGVGQILTNLFFRSAFRPGVTVGSFTQSLVDMFNGMVHSARNELPFIVRTGYHTQRELPGGEVAGYAAQGIPSRAALESTPLPGGQANPLNWYRYVGRVLHGMETVFYRGAHNALMRTLVMREADRTGMTSVDAQRLAEQVIYGTENDRQEAKVQALAEQKRFGFDDQMRNQRELELIDQKRLARAPELAADEAHRFALHSIYREAPYGMLGQLARTLNEQRRQSAASGAALSTIVPFINLPTNVANEFMNWTPIGIWRGRDALFHWGDEEHTQAIRSLYKDVPGFEKMTEKDESGKAAISDRELRDLSYEYLAKGVAGTLGIAALGAMSVANRKTPNPPFMISGTGPATLADRDALRATGWRPYTVKVGDMYIDYQASPLKGMLGVIGGVNDILRFSRKEPENWMTDALTMAAKDGLSTITDASFLQGLQTFLSASGGGGGVDAQNAMERFISQQAATAVMIPFGGTGTRQIYRVFDPREFSGKELPQLIARNIPIVNSAFLQPKLNVLGEPVTSSPLNRIVPSVRTSDEVWKFIDEHNITISLPNAGRRVAGEPLTPEELQNFTLIRGQYLRNELAKSIQNEDFRALDKDQLNEAVHEMERSADDVARYQVWLKRPKENQ